MLENRNIPIWILAITLVISLVLAFAGKAESTFANIGTVLSSIFSGLALLGVIAAYLLQTRQLDQTNEQLLISRQEQVHSEYSTQINLLNQQIDDLRNDIEHLHINDGKSDFFGSTAILRVSPDMLFRRMLPVKEASYLKPDENGIRDQINAIVVGFENIFARLNEVDIPTYNKQQLKIKTSFLFYSKIFWTIKKTLWPFKNALQLLHDDSNIFFPKYAVLCQLVNDYLRSLGYISENKDKSDPVLLYTPDEDNASDAEVDTLLLKTTDDGVHEFTYKNTDDKRPSTRICKHMVKSGLISVNPMPEPSDQTYQEFENNSVWVKSFTLLPAGKERKDSLLKHP